jgi:hypothetical protein
VAEQEAALLLEHHLLEHLVELWEQVLHRTTLHKMAEKAVLVTLVVVVGQITQYKMAEVKLVLLAKAAEECLVAEAEEQTVVLVALTLVWLVLVEMAQSLEAVAEAAQQVIRVQEHLVAVLAVLVNMELLQAEQEMVKQVVVEADLLATEATLLHH